MLFRWQSLQIQGILLLSFFFPLQAQQSAFYSSCAFVYMDTPNQPLSLSTAK